MCTIRRGGNAAFSLIRRRQKGGVSPFSTSKKKDKKKTIAEGDKRLTFEDCFGKRKKKRKNLSVPLPAGKTQKKKKIQVYRCWGFEAKKKNKKESISSTAGGIREGSRTARCGPGRKGREGEPHSLLGKKKGSLLPQQCVVGGRGNFSLVATT